MQDPAGLVAELLLLVGLGAPVGSTLYAIGLAYVFGSGNSTAEPSKASFAESAVTACACPSNSATPTPPDPDTAW